MAVPKLKYSSGNSASTTSASAINDSDTSLPLTSDTNFSAKSGEGQVIINEGTASEELAYATGKSGSSLTIPLVNRGLEGTSAAGHASGVSVKGILTSGMWNDAIDTIKVQHNDDGTHKAITADSAEINGVALLSSQIIQIKTSSTLGQVTATNVGTETYWGQLSITPKKSTSTIVAFLFANGLDNTGSGRLTIRVRHDTSTGGVTGAQIATAAYASDSTAINGLGSLTLLGTVAPGNTTERFFKATVTKEDSSTEWFAGRYSIESKILLMEVGA